MTNLRSNLVFFTDSFPVLPYFRLENEKRRNRKKTFFPGSPFSCWKQALFQSAFCFYASNQVPLNKCENTEVLPAERFPSTTDAFEGAHAVFSLLFFVLFCVDCRQEKGERGPFLNQWKPRLLLNVRCGVCCCAWNYLKCWGKNNSVRYKGCTPMKSQLRD